MKIDWKRKLTSRKLWFSIALGYADSEATQIASLIIAGATVIGYVVGEGLADAGHVEDKS